MAERGSVEPTASNHEAADAPDPLLTINDIAKVLKALENVFDWYSLGTYLEVASHELAAIQAENHTIRSRLIKMLEQWLRNGRDCSWRKLVEVLYRLGEMTVAENIHRNLSLTTPVMPKCLSGHDPSAAPEARALLAQNNKQRLVSKFSLLVTHLSTRFSQMESIKVTALRTYLIAYGSGFEHFINDVQRQDSLSAVFDAISRHKLWNYLNFYLAQYLVEGFAPNDQACLNLLEKYKCDFTGYLLTTEIVHHISAVRVERGEGPTATPPEDISSEELCSKLTVKLDIDVTTHSLKYVEEVWKTLLRRSQLPKHTLLLREIAKSSLIITWLLPKNKAGKVADAVRQNVNELQLKKIVLVTIDGADIFRANPIKVDQDLQSLADSIEADLGDPSVAPEGGGVEATASEAADAPKPLLTVADIAKVLKELEKIVDWYHLGTHLEVEAHHLEAIRYDNPTSKHRMIKMLEQWLRNGQDCSWRKLVEALYLRGEITVADNICRKLSLTTPVMPKYLFGHDSSAPPEARALLAQKNKQQLMSKFSSFVTDLSTRFSQLPDIELTALQTYLATFGGDHDSFVDDVKQQDSLPKMFSTISRHKLWDYLNFDLARYLVEGFAPDDKACLDLLEKYNRNFTGYLLTNEIVHHLSAVRVKRGEGSTATPPEDISPEELCSKLTVKLDIDVTTHSLKYVEEVWKTLLRRSQMPKHTLLLRDMAEL